MKALLRKVIDVRRGEWAVLALMLSYYYVLLMTFYFLKPARDSLFLIKLTPQQLPFVFILSAIAAVPVTALYSRAAARLSLVSLINATTVVLLFCLIGLRLLIRQDAEWIFYLLYIWVGLYGILVTAQFWLLANAVYDHAQAKRIFTLLGSAGIIGAVTGGELTNFLIQNLKMPTENLLAICAALLVASMILVTSIWRLRGLGKTDPAPATPQSEPALALVGVYRAVKQSRLLWLIIALIAIAVMVSTFIDFIFKDIGYSYYAGDKDGMTAFFGRFYGRVSLISLAIQLLLSYRILRALGVGGALLMMPLAVLTGSVAVMAVPALLSAIFLKGAEGSLEYSIDRIGRELLFLPIPLDVKKRTKVFIDIFVDRWFRGLAGILLLVLTLALTVSSRQLALIVGIMVVGWGIIAWNVRREYANAFRLALERRDIDLSEVRFRIDDAATLNSLTTSLSSPNARQVAYALDLLKSAKSSELITQVTPLLKHESPEVRRKAVEFLQDYHESVV